MSADVLRAAAALMRERAMAASNWDGLPWFAVKSAVYGGTAAPHQVVTPLTFYDGDAEHIASWHPGIAPLVADWLDRCAWLLENDTEVYGFVTTDYAIPVARAYLGDRP